jgi:DNA-binding NarL/FixJ family response regulator
MPAMEHGRGLILLAQGKGQAAYGTLKLASAAWLARRRFWEGTWSQLDLAAAAAQSGRRREAARLAGEVRDRASAAGAVTLAEAAARTAGSVEGGQLEDPWYPLTAREFEVAALVADGLTNPQIAGRLTLATKTVSSHVSHILVKLSASRRSEIAAWHAVVAQGNSPEGV